MAGKTVEGSLVFFCVPGDRELSPVKSEWAVPGVELLDEDDFEKYGIPKGSLGPVNPPAGALIVADKSLEGEVAWGIGANGDGFHFFGAMPGRDSRAVGGHRARTARRRLPACGGSLKGARGIEVSQVFQLGTRYSETMGASFTAEEGSGQPFLTQSGAFNRATRRT